MNICMPLSLYIHVPVSHDYATCMCLAHPNHSLGGVGELRENVEVKDDGHLGINGAEGTPLLRPDGLDLVKTVVQLLEATLKVSNDGPTVYNRNDKAY